MTTSQDRLGQSSHIPIYALTLQWHLDYKLAATLNISQRWFPREQMCSLRVLHFFGRQPPSWQRFTIRPRPRPNHTADYCRHPKCLALRGPAWDRCDVDGDIWRLMIGDTWLHIATQPPTTSSQICPWLPRVRLPWSFVVVCQQANVWSQKNDGKKLNACKHILHISSYLILLLCSAFFLFSPKQGERLSPKKKAIKWTGTDLSHLRACGILSCSLVPGRKCRADWRSKALHLWIFGEAKATPNAIRNASESPPPWILNTPHMHRGSRGWSCLGP